MTSVFYRLLAATALTAVLSATAEAAMPYMMVDPVASEYMTTPTTTNWRRSTERVNARAAERNAKEWQAQKDFPSIDQYGSPGITLTELRQQQRQERLALLRQRRLQQRGEVIPGVRVQNDHFTQQTVERAGSCYEQHTNSRRLSRCLYRAVFTRQSDSPADDEE